MSLSHVVSCLMPVPVVICYDLRGPKGLTTGPIHCSKAQSRNGGALGTPGLMAVWWGVQCAGPGLGFHRQLWSKAPIPIAKPGGRPLQQPAVARAGPCSSQLWPGQLCTDVGSLGAGPPQQPAVASAAAVLMCMRDGSSAQTPYLATTYYSSY